MVQSDDDDDVPATQPVMSLLLQGVVAYVEVRSGHDNRSRGVKTHLRNLGATVVDTLTKDVTHVIFNEGLPSTYKKAKKFNCHLVSVLWIEACKDELTKVGEAGYPPIGQQIYEDPQALKNFKKLKSFQPDFDDEVDEMKTKRICRKIKQRNPKTTLVPASVVPEDVTDATDIPTTSTRTQAKQRATQKRTTVKKGAKKTANSKTPPKKSALKEITPDVVNKVVVFNEVEVETSPHIPQEPFNELPLSSHESVSSRSSSVICCGSVEEVGTSTKRVSKPSKYSDKTPISRTEFVEGLNEIVHSLSEEENLKTYEMSPWRKRVGSSPCKSKKKMLTSVKVPPRRSPRCATGLLTCASPRRKSRQIEENENLISKNKNKNTFKAPIGTAASTALMLKNNAQEPLKASSCISASAALARKQKVPQLPSSPGDDFMLLSQEPGDMPSIDEIAKQGRVSIHAGSERITLSQVVRSYNAVATKQNPSPISLHGNSGIVCDDEPTLHSDSNSKHSGTSTSREDILINIEDVSCNAGLVAVGTPSEAGSTASSFSTRVLINGVPQDKADKMVVSDCLPGSEELDFDELHQPSAGETCTVDKYDREPSPIFVIKKPKFRRPMKNQTLESQENDAIKHTSCSLTGKSDQLSKTSCSVEVTGSVKEKRESLNPIEYINKFFLPRFSLASKTPNNTQRNEVLVEETPDVTCASTRETDGVIIPPTPNNPQLEQEEPVASPTQSLTSSVISWVKKSCKVPLFSHRTNRSLQTPTPENDSSESSEKYKTLEPVDCAIGEVSPKVGSSESISKETPLQPKISGKNSNCVANLSLCSSESSKQQSTGKTFKSKKLPNTSANMNSSEDCVEPTSPTIITENRSQSSLKKSLRHGHTASSSKSVQPKSQRNLRGREKKEDMSYTPADSKSEVLPAAGSVPKTRKTRRKIIVSVFKDKETVSKNHEGNLNTSSSKPALVIQKLDERNLSSGYESSNSQISKNCDKAGSVNSKSSGEPTAKKKKIIDLLSPITDVPKKRSEIYDNGETPVSPTPVSPTSDEAQGDKSNSHKTRGRKRNQDVPNVESSKKQKLNSSEPQNFLKVPATHLRRADSRSLSEARSHSDLSAEQKSSGRKSSEVAKKRMAKSLTRNNRSDTQKVIVCTFLTASEQNGIEAAGESLEGWKLEEKVTARTTHVINSGPKRTLNMLKGMSRGCWLVDQKWMLDSSKAGTWLGEENYELVQFSPAVRQCRLKREAIGKEFKHSLFIRAGPIYVSPKTEGPPAKDIRELLELCSADLRTSPQDAKIVIGEDLKKKGTYQCVHPRWVLDCITSNKILPTSGPTYRMN